MLGDRRTGSDAEAERLEQLWAGDFGDAYIGRNEDAGSGRHAFWARTIEELSPQRVLEVGCNIGGNLRHIAAHISPRDVFGVDVSQTSLEKLRVDIPAINPVWARAQELPFRDSWFDLVFTVGVLIHQPEATLLAVMSEVHRCAGRHILCAEYFSEELQEVTYRGERGALFKRDYASIYLRNFQDLRVLHEEMLTPADGFDNVTCTVLEKRG